MTLAAGSVSVADDESVTGDGLARALFEARKAAADAALLLPDPNRPPPTYASAIAAQTMDETTAKKLLTQGRLAELRTYAIEATAYASALVGYLTQHAAVTLSGAVATIDTTTSVGLLPNPVVGGLPVLPPDANVQLPVTGSGTLS